MDVQVVSFCHQFGSACHSFRQSVHLIHKHLKLKPVGLLPESVRLEMLHVVRIVVQDSHRHQVLVSFHHQALFVHVRQAHRTIHLGHSALLAPCGYSVQQSLAHLQVVDEIEPPEAQVMVMPMCVSLVVDQRCYTPYHFAVLVSQKQFVLAEIHHGILLRKRVVLVSIQRRTIVRTPLIQLIRKLYKSFFIFSGFYFSNFYH